MNYIEYIVEGKDGIKLSGKIKSTGTKDFTKENIELVRSAFILQGLKVLDIHLALYSSSN